MGNGSGGPDRVGEGVYAAIRQDIVFGRLRAGAGLRLETLRQDYGASISTLREALARLSAEGLVETGGARGFVVAPMSERDLCEVADLRVLMEGHALAQSLRAGDTEWEARVVAAHHRLRRMEERMRAGDPGAPPLWKRYDWEFHQALISACGSRALVAAHGAAFDRYLRYQVQRLTDRGAVSAQEHRELLEAALDRDEGRAQMVLRRHVEGGVAAALGAGGPDHRFSGLHPTTQEKSSMASDAG